MSLTILRDDGELFTFDLTTREDYDPALLATDHPLEDGAVITDHVQQLPLMLSVECQVTHTPWASAGGATGTRRVTDAIDFLRSCERRLLSVISVRLGTFPSMVLLRYPHTVDQVLRLGFALEFRQLRVAASQSVSIPPLQPRVEVRTGAPTEQDVGDQAIQQRRRADRGNTARENPADVRDKSTAAAIYDRARG